MFEDLVNSSKRENDNYVNATKWCKQFGKGKEWSRFMQVETTIKFVEACCQKLNLSTKEVIQAKQGRNGGTWVHPLIAIKLAEWLSPDFEVFVKEVFVAYIEADISLADSIIERTDDLEGLKKHNTKSAARQKQLEGYHDLMNELRKHKCEDIHFATVNKHNNQLIGVETRKAGLTKDEVSVVTILENFERLRLSGEIPTKPWKAVNLTKDAGNRLMQFLAGELIPETRVTT
jgi:hypothetical protein